jgi:uncharacterized protein with GYD domain
MPKYLVSANYVGDGIKGLMAEGGTKRRDAARTSIESVGGTMECFYFAVGDTDVFGVCDFPDEASAVAWSLMVNSTGAVRLHLVQLVTPEVLDASVTKTPSYRAPGT